MNINKISGNFLRQSKENCVQSQRSGHLNTLPISCKNNIMTDSFVKDNFRKYSANDIFSFRGTLNVDSKLSKEYFDTSLVPDMCADFAFIKGKKELYELSVDEKRNLLKNLTQYKNEILTKKSQLLINSDIIPNNKKEYSFMIDKLVKSIGINTSPVDKILIGKYVQAMEKMAESDSSFLNTEITKDTFKLELDYSRNDFVNDVLDILNELPEIEKNKVCNYFGFEIKENKFQIIQMNGYPSTLTKPEEVTNIEENLTQNAIEQIRQLVDKFNNNKITVEGNPELSEHLNDIIGLFPEVLSIIGKEQHQTHSYTVDVHTLKVLQGVMSDPEYRNLSREDKKILNTAVLLHDITKAEKSIDKKHPKNSAIDSYYLLQKTDFTELEKIKIFILINNHDWLERYNGRVYLQDGSFRPFTDEERAKAVKDIAIAHKNINLFKMASILAKADLKGVKEDDLFFKRFGEAYNQGVAEISQYYQSGG